MTVAVASCDIKALDALIHKTQRKVNELRRMEIELRTLKTARLTLTGTVPADSQAAGAKDAVIDFLRRTGGVHTSQQVAELLRFHIFSRSDDPRRVVLSTISNLVQAGVIQRDALGRLSLAQSEVAMMS